jgi:hypothetical protein
VIREWGATAAERHATSAADALLPDAGEHWVRAVDVAAPPALLWRWLCQLRAAPYSYDWIDNLGRRSPQELTPGLEQLAVGKKLLVAFRVAGFATGEELTIITRPRSRLLTPFAVSYVIVPRGPRASRLIAHIRVEAPPALPHRLARAALAVLCAGDLVMMRKQLLNLQRLAERDARRTSG